MSEATSHLALSARRTGEIALMLRYLLPVIDMRMLPDPLQDDLYLFYLAARAELRERPDGGALGDRRPAGVRS